MSDISVLVREFKALSYETRGDHYIADRTIVKRGILIDDAQMQEANPTRIGLDFTWYGYSAAGKFVSSISYPMGDNGVMNIEAMYNYLKDFSGGGADLVYRIDKRGGHTKRIVRFIEAKGADRVIVKPNGSNEHPRFYKVR